MPKASTDEHKSVLKTIRLHESLVRSLEEEAAEEGTSVNSDVNSILGRHFDLNKRMREFGFVTTAKQTFVRLIEAVDDETLARIGREAIPGMYEEMAELWFQGSSPEKIIDAINLRLRFDASMQGRITREGDMYSLVLRHDLGPKWSVLCESAAREIAKRLFNTEPLINRGDSVVTARFRVKPKTKRATLPS